MKKIIIFLIIFLSSSAVFANNSMGRVIQSWIGENIDTVISYWGYPSKEKTIAGHHLYIWQGNRITQYNSTTYSSYTTFCDRMLEVNDKSIVIAGGHKGSNCPIYIGKKHHWVNPNNNYWKTKEEQKAMQKKVKAEEKLEKKETNENSNS